MDNRTFLSEVELIGIVILWVYYTIPLASTCLGTFGTRLSNCWNYSVWPRIDDEGSVPEMLIWFILLIQSDLNWCIHLSGREKGRYLTQSYDKRLYTNRNVKNANNATKKFDYTAVEDRLSTVSWSNYSHPTGVVNMVYGPNLPTPRNRRIIKRTQVMPRPSGS